MDNNVIAKVGDVEITKQHMINIIRSLPQQQAMEISTQAGAKRLLDEMVAGELLYLDAVENNLEQDEEFKNNLEEAKHGLLQQYAIQKLLQNVQATDEEISDYFERNKSKFVSPDQRRARHILVEQEAEAKKIKGEIENGLDFSEAAKKYSTCPSKEEGGNLGVFEKGRMVPEFEKAAFALEVGELSDLVKTNFGYHLILVDEKIEAGEKTFEEVASQIHKIVSQEKQGEIYEAKLSELRNKYPIVINEEALQ